jgi:hypothetical protein
MGGKKESFQICLQNKVSKEIEEVEIYTESATENIYQRLIKLQLQYCNDKNVKIVMQEYLIQKNESDKGKTYEMAVAESNCDYSYISIIKELKT